MLGDAHFHYSMGKHSEALALLSEVVRQAPSIPDSYHALGLIYEERQEKVSQSRAVRPRVARRADDARCPPTRGGRVNSRGRSQRAADRSSARTSPSSRG